MRMLKDRQAVSPAIAEVLMIVVVTIAAAIVAAYAYTILQHATVMSSVNLLIEGAKIGSSSITIVHMGGDNIPNAFAVSASAPTHYLNESYFNALEVRVNGELFDGWAFLNAGAISKPGFEVGDELLLQLGHPLEAGDSISVVFVPSNQVLRWAVAV
jgi:hypothetical protein